MQLDKEPAIVIREPDLALQLTPQNDQLMSERPFRRGFAVVILENILSTCMHLKSKGGALYNASAVGKPTMKWKLV
jgi:hypothetical protein